MLDKRTVFILGAGASCPYGYPSGARLREHICLDKDNPTRQELKLALKSEEGLGDFEKKFENSSTKSVDLFLARNPKLATIGKHIITFEIFSAENRSLFRERAEQTQYAWKHREYRGGLQVYLRKKDFEGGDWYSYLFDRLTAGLASRDFMPDFSKGEVAFITFNYDRSLEHFLYESFRNSFTEVSEPQIVQCLQSLKILHVYGQIAPLKWQDSTQGVDYRPSINASLLRSASPNVRTIYEEQQNPELTEARELISQAEQIFLLGFGYAPENMEVLDLPNVIPPGNCRVYGTAFGLYDTEVERITSGIRRGLRPGQAGFKNPKRVVIRAMDCLELLRKYLD